ncbi:phosphoribosyl 1,2-cyclic phosphodiesterase [Streptomyces sp. TE33382]
MELTLLGTGASGGLPRPRLPLRRLRDGPRPAGTGRDRPAGR